LSEWSSVPPDGLPTAYAYKDVSYTRAKSDPHVDVLDYPGFPFWIISLLRALYRFIHKKEAQLMLQHDGLCVRLAHGLEVDLEAVEVCDASPILLELSRCGQVT